MGLSVGFEILGPNETFADRLFESGERHARFVEELGERALRWIPSTELVPWSGVTADGSDRSVAFHNCTLEMRLPDEALERIWDAGFEAVHLHHCEGSVTSYKRNSATRGASGRQRRLPNAP